MLFNVYSPNVDQQRVVRTTTTTIRILNMRNRTFSCSDIISAKKINLNFQDDNG